jgi:ParB-like chromosome segregation protein Spo0J
MATLKELTPDPKNRRRHTSRNVDMVRESIEQVGTGRSIVIDEDDVVLAGNATVKAAGLAGLTKLKIVEAEGDEVIAVRRRGLSSEQKRALALYDNRTAELAEWDVEQLVEDVDAGLDLETFFDEDELAGVLQRVEEISAPNEFTEVNETLSTDYCCPKCGYRWSGQGQ